MGREERKEKECRERGEKRKQISGGGGEGNHNTEKIRSQMQSVATVQDCRVETGR